MEKRGLIVVLLIFVFMIGWSSNSIYSNFYAPHDLNYVYDEFPLRYEGDSRGENQIIEKPSTFDTITGRAISSMLGWREERKSPYDRIKENQILLYKDKIVIKVRDATWTAYADTNSMDPVLDAGANGLQIVPKSEKDIHIGDIISFEIPGVRGFIPHRVVAIGNDQKGWYAKVKGDNNPEADPIKVRFNQIRFVLIGVLY